MVRLAEEIQLTRPPACPEEEVFLNLQRTASVLLHDLAEVLRSADLSPTQYNVLRILRGAGEEGLTCGEVSSRMVTHDSDVTRILDRLENRQLIRRERSRDDRRVVRVWITGEGGSSTDELDLPIRDIHQDLLGHLGPRRLSHLNQLLEDARTAPAARKTLETHGKGETAK